MMCHVRSGNITWIEVHHGILFDRRLAFNIPYATMRVGGDNLIFRRHVQHTRVPPPLSNLPATTRANLQMNPASLRTPA